MLVDAVLSHGSISGSYLCGAQDDLRLLVGGVFSFGPMGDFYLRGARDARGCSWMGRSPMDPSAAPSCAAHRARVDARGRGTRP